MSGWEYRLVALPDGRQLEVLDHGTADRVLVWLTGTPGGAVPDPEMAAFVARHDLRVLQPLRPGYGQSDPRPGRRIVDLAEDVDAVLQALDVAAAICVGGSGGGPHVLALAARLPRCRAAAALVSPAPRDAEGLDYYDGMALSNQEEWRLADQGPEAVRDWLEKAAADLLEHEGTDAMLDQFGDCYSAPDRAVMTPERAPLRASAFAKAVERGIEGWFEDDIAMTTPWGFELDEIGIPVSIWTGRQDRFLSPNHSVWLAARVPGADLHVLGGEGHLSLKAHHFDAVFADLIRKAGWE